MQSIRKQEESGYSHRTGKITDDIWLLSEGG